MNIKHSIGLNLSADAIPGRLHMVQGDANSRTIVATLWDGAQLYSIPAGAAIMVRFRKPDGTGGLYDATESGSKVSYVGSIVTAPVATQMLAVAGDVFAEIDIFGSSSGAEAERLATFRFVVEVAPCVLPDAKIISSDYYNILASKVAEAIAAAERAEQAQSAAAASAEAAATSAANAATSVEGAVKYNTPQTLTDAQKQQARDNINAPAPYTAGENISISGSVIATKAFPCNPNLLDNWYFGNPVNQRNGYVVYGGANLYTDATCTTVVGTVTGGPYQAYPISSICVSFTTNATYYCKIGDSGVVPGYNGAGYGIDRWQALSSGLVLTISDGCITISNTEQGKGGTISEKTEVKNTGSPVVMSVLLKNGTLFVTSGVPTADASLVVLKEGLYAGFRASENNCLEALFYFSGTTVAQESIVAVKLELGTQQTLAHQENGVWVLNEIPDYGEQLRRCHRYYFKTASAQYSAYMMRKNTDDYLMDSCIFPVTMRTTPSVQLVSYRNPSTGAVITAEGDASQTTPDGFCVVNDAGKFAGSSVFQVAFSASADL